MPYSVTGQRTADRHTVSYGVGRVQADSGGKREQTINVRYNIRGRTSVISPFSLSSLSPLLPRPPVHPWLVPNPFPLLPLSLPLISPFKPHHLPSSILDFLTLCVFFSYLRYFSTHGRAFFITVFRIYLFLIPHNTTTGSLSAHALERDTPLFA